MVIVSSMEIKGKFDSSNIVMGFKKMTDGMKEMTKLSGSVFSDLVRMAGVGGKLIGIMTGLGAVGAGTMLALAKGSPAVAPAMAKIKVATQQLKFALGQQLRPVFDGFADAYYKFVNFVESHPNLLENIWNSTGIGRIQDTIKYIKDLLSATTLQDLQDVRVPGPTGFQEAGESFAENTLIPALNNLPINPLDPIGMGIIIARAISSLIGQGESETNRRNQLISWVDNLWS